MIWYLNDRSLSFPGIPVNYNDVASIDPEYAKNLQVSTKTQEVLLINHFLLVNHVLLYPTQRVAVGIMFLTSQLVSQSVSQSVRQSCFSC